MKTLSSGYALGAAKYRFVGACLGTALLAACGGVSSLSPSGPAPSGAGVNSRMGLAQGAVGSAVIVRYAYVANSSDGDVSAYTISDTTSKGALTQVKGSPFAAGGDPFGVAVDPTGKFAYVPNAGSDNVTACGIDASSGALTPVKGSPFAAGGDAFGVAIDPTGKFAYTANGDSDNISAYTINASSGALTPVKGSPFAAGSSPYSVVVDPKGKFVYAANGASDNVSPIPSMRAAAR